MRNPMLLILPILLLSGCVGYRLSHVHGLMNGNAIVTPYGPLSGNVTYDATTCFGQCPQANMETINAAN